jgi:hypothetical protein
VLGHHKPKMLTQAAQCKLCKGLQVAHLETRMTQLASSAEQVLCFRQSCTRMSTWSYWPEFAVAVLPGLQRLSLAVSTQLVAWGPNDQAWQAPDWAHRDCKCTERVDVPASSRARRLKGGARGRPERLRDSAPECQLTRAALNKAHLNDDDPSLY